MSNEIIIKKGSHKYGYTTTNFEYETINNKKNGLYQEWYPNGQLAIHVYYVNDEMHGLYQSWHENGQMHDKCYYINGKIHGKTYSWSENGQMKLNCNYYQGKRHGMFMSWYPNGNKFVNAIDIAGKSGYYRKWEEHEKTYRLWHEGPEVRYWNTKYDEELANMEIDK